MTSVTRPSNPTTGLSYTLWGDIIYKDFTQTWTQTPACGHAVTDSFVWSGTNDYVKADTAIPGRVNVNTGALAAVGTHTVSVQNTVTIASNGNTGSTTFNPTDSNDKVEMTFTITNPC